MFLFMTMDQTTALITLLLLLCLKHHMHTSSIIEIQLAPCDCFEWRGVGNKKDCTHTVGLQLWNKEEAMVSYILFNHIYLIRFDDLIKERER